jgi:hypothetical protein
LDATFAGVTRIWSRIELIGNRSSRCQWRLVGRAGMVMPAGGCSGDMGRLCGGDVGKHSILVSDWRSYVGVIDAQLDASQ